MSETQSQVREQQPLQSDSDHLAAGPAQLRSANPPVFQLQADPIQRKVDYEPFLKKAIPIMNEIKSYEGRMISQELRFYKGAQLQDIFKEVQAAGGKNSEFLKQLQGRVGAGPFAAMHKSLNEMGLDWALEGATGIRVKNMTDTDLKVEGGGQSFSIRSSPSSKDNKNILGELNHSMEYLGDFSSKTVEKDTGTEFLGIKVRKKGITGIKLNNGKKLEDLPDVVYVGMGGLRITAKWEVFLEQLQNFDTMTMGMSLKEKLTKLRQFGQKKDMGEQMDSELGTRKRDYGHRYQDDRNSYSNVFQMLKEVDQVETPLGTVDMHHFLIAIESYQKKNRDVELDPWWVDFGKMKDVGSFAGNIGAASAEYVLKNSTNYEKTIGKGADANTKMRFYYDTRTTEAELLGELDGWGALPMLEGSKVATLTDLIKGYYGQKTGGSGAAKTEHPRKKALEGFIGHYGLSKTGNTLNNAANIKKIYPINLTFAKGWWKFRKSTFGESSKEKDLDNPTRQMTVWFLEFLTQKAQEYKVF